MTEIFVAPESQGDNLNHELIARIADSIVSTIPSGTGSVAGAAGTTSTTATGGVVDDILSLDQDEAEDLVDLLADRIDWTAAPATGAAAGTYEVSMAGGEDGFQDGEPKDPPGSDGEKDIVKALKEQGFIKDSPGSDDELEDPSKGYGEVDPGTIEANGVEDRNSALLQDWISLLADREVTNGGFDSNVELWI